ncbi:hypothetical protein Ahy_A03g013234 isoform B [Arachis hypogaea]|uniref:Uncharacterized protein n=1 Tax=Arachis hypogaea TaxID=3818 RepID=A0A445DV22_ARAHY|nr:hypothetical protein Ahy_A03g013234 isoform B [Arachis hypogaea]
MKEKLFKGKVEVMEDIVYYNSEIIPNIHEGVTLFVNIHFSLLYHEHTKSHFKADEQHFVQESCISIWWVDIVSNNVRH